MTQVEVNSRGPRKYGVVAWSVFAAMAVVLGSVKLGQYLALANPPAAEAPAQSSAYAVRKYPNKILVFRYQGVDTWQMLSERFTTSVAMTDDRSLLDSMVKLASSSILAHGLSCDTMESILPMVERQHAGLRVACMGDDGFYRTYFVYRHINDSTGSYRVEYINK